MGYYSVRRTPTPYAAVILFLCLREATQHASCRRRKGIQEQEQEQEEEWSHHLPPCEMVNRSTGWLLTLWPCSPLQPCTNSQHTTTYISGEGTEEKKNDNNNKKKKRKTRSKEDAHILKFRRWVATRHKPSWRDLRWKRKRPKARKGKKKERKKEKEERKGKGGSYGGTRRWW